MKKIQVTEAMRLKGEISNYFNQIRYKLNQSYLGDTYVDSILREEIVYNKIKFNEALEHLQKLCTYSEEINTALSNFNRINKIDSLIREKANIQVIIELLTKKLPETKSNSAINTHISSTGEKINTITEYKPFITEESINEQNLLLKTKVRDIQNKVDKLNLKTIDLSFTFDEFERFKIA